MADEAEKLYGFPHEIYLDNIWPSESENAFCFLEGWGSKLYRFDLGTGESTLVASDVSGGRGQYFVTTPSVSRTSATIAKRENGLRSFTRSTLRPENKANTWHSKTVCEAAVANSVVEKLKSSGIAVSNRLWGRTAVETSEVVAEFGLSLDMNADGLGAATTNG
ncbi:MAG: hypothetical protein IJH04_08240 [Eggerthellaceae bacterium]|nr:hypothetical protein [Eggerthellaceae bacterium]